jgi:predicted protein tyrosine phosphatase
MVYVMRVLFVCTVNRLRSPTAETLFSTWPGVEALSAGTDNSATRPLTAELVASVDVIFAMDPVNAGSKLTQVWSAPLGLDNCTGRF